MSSFCTIGLTFLMTFLAATIVRGEILPSAEFTSSDGLLRDSATCVVEDSRGFMWFCTGDGASRFDGHSFRNYTTADGLPNRRVNSILETSSGQYLIGTSNGLALFQPDGFFEDVAGSTEQRFFATFRLAEKDSPSNEILVIFEDAGAGIWCGTSNGLFKVEINDGSVGFTAVPIPDAKPDKPDSVTAIKEDPNGNIVVGLDFGNGIAMIAKSGSAVRYRTNRRGERDDSVKSIHIGRDGETLVGLSVNGGLCVFDPNPDFTLRDCVTKKDGLPSNWVQTIYQTSAGDLWLGTTSGVAFLAQGKSKPKVFGSAEGLCGKGVDGILEDRGGNLWFATNCGIKKIATNGFVRFSENDGLISTSVRGFFKSPEGELYFTTVRAVANSSGNDTALLQLSRFNGVSFDSVEPNLPVGANTGWGSHQMFFRDAEHQWWLPSASGRVFRFPPLSDISALRSARSTAIQIPDAEVFRLFQARTGTVWISTMYDGRLLTIDGDQIAEHRDELRAGGTVRHVNSFAETADGAIWMGSEYVGDLVRFKGGRFEVIPAESDKAGSITFIFCDSKNRLWFTTMQNGVGRIDDPIAAAPAIRWYNRREGLATDGTRGLAEDEFGRIYVGHGRGVDRIDPATDMIRHFGARDGLPPGLNDIIVRDNDGTLWFGGQNGLARMMPAMERPRQVPNVFFSGLRKGGRRLPISEIGAPELKDLLLEPDDNQLAFEIIGIGEGLVFEYRLGEGGWIRTEQRVVEFANLAPGAYRFEVRAMADDGTTSTQPAVATFRIMSPIWQRWWFLAGLAAAFGFLIYLGYRYRVSQILRVERLRTRIATDLHDDIGANLSTISVLSEVARLRIGNRSDEDSRLLASIADTARDSVSSMSDIVWTINPQRDSLLDLSRRMRQFAEEMFVPKGVLVRFQSRPGSEQRRLAMDKRREIYLIFKEAVANAVRHSECTSIEIAFGSEDSRLVLRISDDGIGFDPEAESVGNGLANMRTRAAAIGGTMTISARPKHGTTIVMSIPE